VFEKEDKQRHCKVDSHYCSFCRTKPDKITEVVFQEKRRKGEGEKRRQMWHKQRVAYASPVSQTNRQPEQTAPGAGQPLWAGTPLISLTIFFSCWQVFGRPGALP